MPSGWGWQVIASVQKEEDEGVRGSVILGAVAQ